MSANQIVSLIVLLFLPAMIGLVYVLAQFFISKMPERQVFILEKFARAAVQKIEQQNDTMANDAKKALAEAIIKDAFKTLKLPIPADALIDAAIESICYEIGALKKAQT